MEQNRCSHCFQEKEHDAVCPYCGYDPVQDAGKYPLALPPETVLAGRYILGHVLGQGGFGITYVAMDYQTKSRVAVKEYFPEMLATRTQTTVSSYSGDKEENYAYGKVRFLEEAETLAQFIGNPNIARVYSYFEENHTAYFVMEYIEGESLQQYLKRRDGKLPWEEVQRIFAPVMGALGNVHSKGIIHRDVTPDNILLTKDGVVKLLDFGAARYSLGDKSRSLDVVLKHGFAPVEQYARHGKQGPFTDVYALAASMYYALTGKLPPDAIDRIGTDLLAAPSSLGARMPAEAEDALLKALSVNAQDRFQSMEDFRMALLGQKSQPAPVTIPESVPEPAADDGKTQYAEENHGFLQWCKTNHRLLLGVGGMAVLALVIGLLLGRRTEHHVPPQPEPAAPPAVTETIQTPSVMTEPVIVPVTEAVTEPVTEAVTESALAIRPVMAHVDSINGCTVRVFSNGSVKAYGSNDDMVSGWKDIVAVAGGANQIIGLKKDGTVAAAGHNAPGDTHYHGELAVDDWTDIIAVAAGWYHSVGLRSDGTVVAAGDGKHGEYEVVSWRDICAVAAGDGHIVGLHPDGTVVAVGTNSDGQCDVTGWTDIVAIAASHDHTIGLRKDGTVMAAGYSPNGECSVSGWTDIVAVAAGWTHTLGLRSDGTVVAVGDNGKGECDVSGWTDICEIYADHFTSYGIQSDGRLVAVGISGDSCMENLN